MRKYNKFKKYTICDVIGCLDLVYANGLCKNHYAEIRRKGEIEQNWYDTKTTDLKNAYNIPIYQTLDFDKKDIMNRIYLYISCLDPFNKYILFLRFGLYDKNEKTLKEIADIFNVTIERIRQREGKALRQIRYLIKYDKKTVEDFI